MMGLYLRFVEVVNRENPRNFGEEKHYLCVGVSVASCVPAGACLWLQQISVAFSGWLSLYLCDLALHVRPSIQLLWVFCCFFIPEQHLCRTEAGCDFNLIKAEP